MSCTTTRTRKASKRAPILLLTTQHADFASPSPSQVDHLNVEGFIRVPSTSGFSDLHSLSAVNVSEATAPPTALEDETSKNHAEDTLGSVDRIDKRTSPYEPIVRDFAELPWLRTSLPQLGNELSDHLVRHELLTPSRREGCHRKRR